MRELQEDIFPNHLMYVLGKATLTYINEQGPTKINRDLITTVQAAWENALLIGNVDEYPKDRSRVKCGIKAVLETLESEGYVAKISLSEYQVIK